MKRYEIWIDTQENIQKIVSMLEAYAKVKSVFEADDKGNMDCLYAEA